MSLITETLAELRAVAKRTGMSASKLAEQAIADHLRVLRTYGIEAGEPLVRLAPKQVDPGDEYHPPLADATETRVMATATGERNMPKLRRMLWNRGDYVRPIELINQRLDARR